MKYQKQKLLRITNKILRTQRVTPDETNVLLSFDKNPHDSKNVKFLKHVALPMSLVIGFFFAAFPDVFIAISTTLPSWTNMSPEILAGVDYYWDIIGEPVGKTNIIFHIPNIILYSFGIIGIKKIIDSIDRKTWIDKVTEAQSKLKEHIRQGTLSYEMKKGHSLLFVGKGDFIGMQYTLDQAPSNTMTISEIKPKYTDVWSYYDSNTLYEDLKKVFILSDAETAGEYTFFPVNDDQIFLPGEKAYDLSPHKLDILCQNIRTIEKEMGWNPKRIIIVGDRFHKSYVRSEDYKKMIPNSSDTISLITISKKYKKVSVLDPSDIILDAIIKIAKGRKIVFRATKEGINEYKERFYKRLKLLGYKEKTGTKGILTIGYDLFEDQTEQQTLSRAIDDYLPVVLSKNVYDALIRNGYKPDEFLYAPELVLNAFAKEASEQ